MVEKKHREYKLQQSTYNPFPHFTTNLVPPSIHWLPTALLQLHGNLGSDLYLAVKVLLAVPGIVLVAPAGAQLLHLLRADEVQRLGHHPLHALAVRRRRQRAIISEDIHIDQDLSATRRLLHAEARRLKQVVEGQVVVQRDVVALLHRQLRPELVQKVVRRAHLLQNRRLIILILIILDAVSTAMLRQIASRLLVALV